MPSIFGGRLFQESVFGGEQALLVAVWDESCDSSLFFGSAGCKGSHLGIVDACALFLFVAASEDGRVGTAGVLSSGRQGHECFYQNCCKHRE